MPSNASCKPGSHPRVTAPADPARLAQRRLVSCRLCASRDWQPYLAARGYTIVKCTNCGLVFANPQPGEEELSALYASHHQGDQWNVHEDGFNHAIGSLLLGLRPHGRLLDIGCGSGKFLKLMRDAGIPAFGVERSEAGWKEATESHRLQVFHGSIEEFLQTTPKETFGAVTLLNVLEHLREPASTLTSALRLMSPDALLFVVVPDVRLHALLARLRKLAGVEDPFWMDSEAQPIVAIDPPYHLTCFTAKTLRLMLERCGYRIVKITNAPVISNPELWKRLAKLTIKSAGTLMEKLSAGRIVIGYSALAVARKP